jgi:polyisoprenyl-teichoic acid--peptidoglycan teichoic acid transferase
VERTAGHRAAPGSPGHRPGGRGGRRRKFRRARSVPGALGVTLAGALLPGSGYVWSRRRLGLVILAVSLVAGVLLLGYGGNRDRLIDAAFDPARLRIAAVVIGVVFFLWAFTVITTYLMVRPRREGLADRIGLVTVVALVVAAALPVVQGTRTVMAQADLVTTVFGGQEQTATAPKDVSRTDPWGGRDRVGVLILGGDGGEGRTGVRTDSVILLSIDTRSGRAVMFSLPRNLQNVPFPEHSPLREKFPYGFSGYGDVGNWLLNAIYREVPLIYPGILGESNNEGADALKQAVRATLGTRVDYYVLVNLMGFRQIVDAMGGVTVNVNTQVAIGGDTDAGIPPSDYLQPGPDQHLDGFQALWFSRGRWGSDDYQRMLRQRCMVQALVDEAKPLNLLRRYQALAAAGKEIVFTDIPRDLMPAFVDLGLRMKQHQLRSVAFTPSADFSPAAPDFDWMHSVVDKAIQRSTAARLRPADRRNAGSGGGSGATSVDSDPGESVTVADTCGYHPVG